VFVLQVSQMLPENFSEKCIRVYCKRADAQSVAVAMECFREACEVHDLIPPKVNQVSLCVSYSNS